MLILNLIGQEWLKSIRARGFYKNVVVSIFLGIFTLYIAVIFLILGFSLNGLLEKVPGTMNPTELFSGAMLYMLLGGLALRFFMQQLNTMNLPPYQVLPVKRSILMQYFIA